MDEIEVDAKPVLPDTDLVVFDVPPGFPAELSGLLQRAQAFAEHATAPNTSKAYASDWSDFLTWCAKHRVEPLPAHPAVVATYATALTDRGLKASTIRRRGAAIARKHRDTRHPNPFWDPDLTRVMEGIARDLQIEPDKKLPLLRDQVRDMVAPIDISTLAGLRDRALLLLGFALGLRRSELVALQVTDFKRDVDGARVKLKSSKGDQKGEGHTFLLPYASNGNPCAVRAVRGWIDAAGLIDGTIARRLLRNGQPGGPLSPQSIALIIKKRAAAAGLDAAAFAGHSLRAGYATQASRDGHRAEQIADVTRHKDRRTLDGYVRAGQGAEDIARVL